MVVPFGGTANAPVMVNVSGVAGHSCTVSPGAVVGFNNATYCVGPLPSSFATPGTDNIHVDDRLAVQSGVAGTDYARPAVYRVTQVAATSAAIVNAGGGGPPNATVYLRATTGHGRRPLLQGRTDATGKLDTAVGLTVVEAGCMYMNPANPAAEPLVVDQLHLTLPGSWAPGRQSRDARARAAACFDCRVPCNS